jgi:TolB-like protein
MISHKPFEQEITAEAVRAQLARILKSETFARARRMQRFLEFIVTEALAGRADQLGEYSIGLAVYDRGSDFEPAADPIVRIDARRLRYKLVEYYQRPVSAQDNVIIDIPKGGYVPVFAPASLPERRPAAHTLRQRRIAVLPFEVLSTDTDGPLYGRALCMSLTASLTNLDGVEAVAHTFLREQTLHQAASELRLSHAIQGSILRWSRGARVIVNLIDVDSGTQLWAREFDVESGELLAAVTELGGSVRREVRMHLGLTPPAPIALAKAA